MRRSVVGVVLLTVLFILGGCGKASNSKTPVSGKSLDMIEAPLINTEGTEIGEVTLTEGENGVTIQVVAEGLTPGMHGFHIHEKGQCAPPKFESAGGHFNPNEKEHGFENPKGFHLGDLLNIEVGEDGKVDEVVTTAEVTLQRGKGNSILDEDGSSIMIHSKADDYKTDPSGNSGDRIACAVIAE